jgi:DNA-binding protein YbaB
MSTFVQLLALFDLVAFSAAKAAEIESSSTVTDSIDSDLSSSDSDWKEFDQEMQEMQNQINACPSWTKFASNNINQNGLYCQKNGQNYKCSSTPAGLSGISVGGCPANLNVKRQLRSKKHKKHDSDDSDDWVKQMENEMGEMQNQINACPSWTKASKNLNKKGLYCQKNGQNYKCASKPAGFDGISVGSCPVNLKVQRQLKADKDSDDSATEAQEWKEFDKEMQEMQNQLNACPSWTKFASSSISENGLYCQQNGQNYKCSSSSATNGISVGGCPANLKVDRQLDDSNDWNEFDQQMQQLDNKMQEMQNQINACPSWTKFASISISENGLYCQQNGQNYKCSSTPAGLNGINVGGCPENLNTSNVVMI